MPKITESSSQTTPAICRQLKQAQDETEKLRVAGDAYKRELLQQKLSDTEWALSREQDRAKEAEADKAGGSPDTLIPAPNGEARNETHSGQYSSKPAAARQRQLASAQS